MYIFKRELRNTNANIFKRWLSFAIDLMFSNVVRIVLVKLFLMFNGDIIIKFFDNFAKFFTDFDFNNLKDYQVRYIVRDPAFDKMFYLFLIVMFSGIVYNLLCYFIFKRQTIGQKIMKLEVVNNSAENKDMNFVQKIFRSILSPLPYIITSIMLFCATFNIVGFYKYMQRNTLIRLITYYSFSFVDLYVLGAFIILVIFIWLNVYFVSNRFLLHDIMTHTRVVDKKLLLKYDDNNIDESVVNMVDGVLPFFKNAKNKVFDFTNKCFYNLKQRFTKK